MSVELSNVRVLFVPTDVAPSAHEPAVDGRVQRRERNRAAVVDALLALFHEGRLEASPAEIAERAGVSERSLFRYFDDLDDLRRSAIARHLASIEPLRRVEVRAGAALEERIGVLVSQRAALYDEVGWVGVLTRMRAPVQPVLAAELAVMRASFRDQIAGLFASELAAMAPQDARHVLAAADVLTSFESYQLLRADQQLSREAALDVLRAAISALFHRHQPSAA